MTGERFAMNRFQDDTPGETRERLVSADFHVHSHNSPCGGEWFTVKRIGQVADQLGLRHVCLTDHWMSRKRRPDWHTDPALFEQIRREIDESATAHSVRVSLSAEIEVVDLRGNLSADPETARRLLDWVSVSTHHLHAPFRPSRPTSRFARNVFAAVKALIRNSEVDVLLHCEELVNVAPLFGGEIPRELFAEMAEEGHAAGKVFQVGGALSLNNCDLILRDYYPGLTYDQFMENTVRLLMELVQHQCKIVLGSDAHDVYWPYTEPVILWLGNLWETADLLMQLGFQKEQLWEPAAREPEVGSLS